MKTKISLIIVLFSLIACHSPVSQTVSLTLAGTWQLLSGTVIENGDTAITLYTKNTSFIKIINDTHFAFLQHNPNKDSATGFSAGGGTYTLKDSTYTEHLAYCSAKEWEGNSFPFTITIRNDTLTQRGTEKVANTAINRMNIETYIRVKN